MNDNYVRLLFWVLLLWESVRNVLSQRFLVSLKVLKGCGSKMFMFLNECAFIMKHDWWNVRYNRARSLANRPHDFKRCNFAAMWSNTKQWLKTICVSALMNHFLVLQNRNLERLVSWSFRCWFEWFIATILNHALYVGHVYLINNNVVFLS